MAVLLMRDIKHKFKRTVDPTGLPVTLAEVKRQALKLGTTETADDEEITDWIISAVADVEHDSQRSLMPQTWQLKMDEFPDVIELRKPPIVSVTSVTYLDSEGDSTTLSASLYDTDLVGEPGRIVSADGTCWPVVDCVPNAVTVTFTAGYPGAIPRAAVTAIMLNVKARFNGCEPGDAYWASIDRLTWGGKL